MDNIYLNSTEVKQECQEETSENGQISAENGQNSSENDHISVTEELSQESGIDCSGNIPIFVLNFEVFMTHTST